MLVTWLAFTRPQMGQTQNCASLMKVNYILAQICDRKGLKVKVNIKLFISALLLNVTIDLFV